MTTAPPNEPTTDHSAEAPAVPPGEDAPERQSTPFLVMQFFVFPMAIVAVCVAVFVIFGLIAAEGKSARDYLSEVRSGSANRRWQAAFELSKVLQARKDPALAQPEFASEVATLFEQARNDDPRVRRYLALALGRLGAKEGVPALLATLSEEQPDSDTLIYAVWALGAIGDAAAIPQLTQLVESDDAGVRKAAVHSLGAFASDETRALLATALADSADDVRWNAALALARQGSDAGIEVLGQMLDRQVVAKVPGASPEQQEEVLLQALTAAAKLGDPRLREAAVALRDGDPSLRVRDAAREAVTRLRPATNVPAADTSR